MIQPKIHGFRAVSALLILALFTSAFSAVLINKVANASPLGTRSITMSNSKPNASGVTYSVSLQTKTAAANPNYIAGVVVQFCDKSPIIGDTNGANCNKPGSGGTSTFSLASASISNFKVNGATPSGTWSPTLKTAEGGGAIVVSNASSTATNSVDQLITFDITNVNNSDLGNNTFYARIYTYRLVADANPTAYTFATPGTHTDDGGVAMSTSNELQITAKVQERLTFCITDSAGTCTAGSTTTTAYQNTTGANTLTKLNLGDVNGVLDAAKQFGKKAKMFVQTNAQGNVSVVMRGETLCSLPQTTTGTGTTPVCTGNSIPAIGSTAVAGTIGTAQFGMCIDPTGASTFTIPAPYGNGTAGSDTTTLCASGLDDTAGSSSAQTTKYGFDGTAARSATGSTVASVTPGPMNSAAVGFMANISNTTKAGIYTSTLQFTATGSY